MRSCAVLIIFAVLLLGGCGQKGPLYLPQSPQSEPVQDDTDSDSEPVGEI